MIRVGFWSYYEEHCRNNLHFRDPHLGPHENCTRKFVDLYAAAQARGIELLSLDLLDAVGKADCFLFQDLPRMRNPLVQAAFAAGKPRLLIADECEVVRPANWAAGSHRPFEKVFTWRDDLIDNRRYFKVNVHFLETKAVPRDLSIKKKLVVLVASNKRSLHPLELYSRRREAIRWFERHHPSDFDLFGHDWDLFPFPADHPLVSRLNSRKLLRLRRLIPQSFPSWRGEIPKGSKKDVLSRYRFAICYDNARDIPGYILEKIFDSFAAGTVPIYWGASNVEAHIPRACFIDKREFPSYDGLYERLRSMPDHEYLERLGAIERFLNSEAAREFSSEHFSEVILREISATVGESQSAPKAPRA